MRIVFMGTPEFAAAHLSALLEINREIAGVFTQPDRKSGRGMKLVKSPVKLIAEEHNIPIFQPKKMRDAKQGLKEGIHFPLKPDDTALSILKELSPDIIIVVAYGRILPREILDLPPRGCINIHASLLPKLRGAAPIQWAIAKGFSHTGVTSMKMAEECDAGNVYFQESLEISPSETATTLHDRLIPLGCDVLKKTIDAIERGDITPAPQDHSAATFAPILQKHDGVINPELSPEEAERLIRAMNPWPGAMLPNGLKIHKAELANGELRYLEVQAPGKKRMSFEEYYRGSRN